MAVKAYGNPPSTDDLKSDYKHMISAVKKYSGIKDRKEMVMFIANILHESDGLKAQEEYFCKSAMNACRTAYHTPGQDESKVYYFIQLTGWLTIRCTLQSCSQMTRIS